MIDHIDLSRKEAVRRGMLHARRYARAETLDEVWQRMGRTGKLKFYAKWSSVPVRQTAQGRNALVIDAIAKGMTA